MSVTRLPVLVLVLLTAGCATRGEYVDPDEIDELQGAVTTAEQLHGALGTPSVTIPRDDGKTMWVYEGIYMQADATQYIPYLNFLIGTTSKECTQLSVLVDSETGELSAWNYTTATDTDFWAKTNDKCTAGKSDWPRSIFSPGCNAFPDPVLNTDKGRAHAG